MPWFKVDDNLAFHAKVCAAGNPAMGLWVRAGSWSALQLTDGFIPNHMLLSLGTKQQGERLVQVGLWDRTEGGYRFHEWGDRQPSRASVEAERAAARERMRKAREARKNPTQKASPQVSDPRSGELPAHFDRTSGDVRVTRPDPTRPSKKNTSSAGADGPFEEFWQAYPRKVGKQAARKVWDRKIRDTPTADIMAGLQAYLPVYAKADQQFIPHPSTWLQRGSWEDEVSPGDTVEDLPHYWRTGGDPA